MVHQKDSIDIRVDWGGLEEDGGRGGGGLSIETDEEREGRTKTG